MASALRQIGNLVDEKRRWRNSAELLDAVQKLVMFAAAADESGTEVTGKLLLDHLAAVDPRVQVH